MSIAQHDSALQQLLMDCMEDDEQLSTLAIIILIFMLYMMKPKRCRTYNMIDRIPQQVQHLNRLIGTSNADCISNLRMDRNAFGRLVFLMRHLGGLVDGKYVTVEEQVATFIGILSHHKKNRVVGFDYLRSGQTISKYVHVVLRAILKLHNVLLVKPEPVPDNCTDHRWKWFKGCLGAIDGTYIDVKVPSVEKPRYRSRKGQICTNTLAVVDRDLRFVYVLPGWEGSAADSRVLRDAVNRENGLKVPKGFYYLADNGYANSEGFLTPFRGIRYHLKEWGPDNMVPANHKEIFNMRHSKARNAIERAFGIMKMRWGILRSASYYPIKLQVMLIGACFLLHNFIRSQMEVDPMEALLDNYDTLNPDNALHEEVEYIDFVESTAQWNAFRDAIANEMWQHRHQI